MMKVSGFSSAVWAIANSRQYDDEVRYRLMYDKEAKKYEVVGRPDWPACRDAMVRGEYRLVLGLTGREIRKLYEVFCRFDGEDLFDDSVSKSMDTGTQQGGDVTKLDVRPLRDNKGKSGEDDVVGGARDNAGAAGGGGEGGDGGE